MIINSFFKYVHILEKDLYKQYLKGIDLILVHIKKLVFSTKALTINNNHLNNDLYFTTMWQGLHIERKCWQCQE